jgi:AraC-like DNA-binding protein
VLREVCRTVVPELDAIHAKAEVRWPTLRVGTEGGRHIASDFALVEHAAPFVHHVRCTQLVVLLEGVGRFDEAGRRVWFEAGSMMLSDSSAGGLDAFAGERSRWLVLSWDPDARGAPHRGPLEVAPVGKRDLARLDELSRELAGPNGPQAAARILDLARSHGLGFEQVSIADLEHHAPAEAEQSLHRALTEQLSKLDTFPAVSDLVREIGSGERQLHRRIAKLATRYQLPWSHWRSALHHARMAQAIRLLGAPGATTELVALRAGFRSPTSLCHAFADSGLPSPGALARAARREGLAGWAGVNRQRAA